MGTVDGDTLGHATFEMLRVIRGERDFDGKGDTADVDGVDQQRFPIPVPPENDPTIADPTWTPEPFESDHIELERVDKERHAAGYVPKWFKGPDKIRGQYALFQWGAATFGHRALPQESGPTLFETVQA